MTSHPRIVIGLPVYNGENYVREAIESILAQTFTDFRLVIGDNCSTDRTSEICQEYVKRDSRVQYHRQERNLGVVGNSNFLFDQCDAPYFKWQSHDDVLAPTFLERCLEVIEADPSLSIVHCRSLMIDEHGDCIGNYDGEVPLSDPRVSERLWRILWAGYINESFGVMRTSMLKKTELYRPFDGSDRNLIMEMLLQGDVAYVNEYLFLRRDHPDCYCRQDYDSEIKRNWFDPTKSAKTWHLKGPVKSKEYLQAIMRTSMPFDERLRCLRMLTEWTLRRSIESATGVGEKFGNQFRQEFAGTRIWSEVKTMPTVRG